MRCFVKNGKSGVLKNNFKRILLSAFSVFASADVIALMIPAYKADLFLRPAAMISLFLFAFSSKGLDRSYSLLLLIGLFSSVVIETLQTIGLAMPVVAVATAFFYIFYSAAFFLRRPRDLGWKMILPFALSALYSIVLFSWLAPYGFLRIAAYIYVPVFIFFTGSAISPLLGHPDRSEKFRAAGAFLLALSDTIRAFTLFKDTFPLSESIILTLYFCGQISLALSIRGDGTNKL